MRLLELPEEIKIALVTKDISQGYAKALLAIQENPEQQMILFGLIKDENLSVRLAEEMSRKAKRKKKKRSPKIENTGDEDNTINSIKNRFNQSFKLVKKTATSGKIEFKYNSTEELERFLEKLDK